MNNTDISNLIVKILSELDISEVCLCPGARNSPIIAAFSKTNANLHSILDERSAGFYALGISKIKREPVVISCTSGTALANLFPSIIEARMSEIPLIIITADRPKRMIGKGENQTIHQDKIYGKYVRNYINIDALEDTKESITDKITKIINSSLGKTNGEILLEKGPIHINIHLEEPLLDTKSNLSLENLVIAPIKFKEHNKKILKIDNKIKRPIIICGQSDLTYKASTIIDISNKIGAPILADISSNIHSSNRIISFYEHFIDKLEAPDLILRFGSKPLSKKLLSLMKKYSDITYLVRLRSTFNDDILKSHLIDSINYEGQVNKNNSEWLNTFIKKDDLINRKINTIIKDFDLNEYIFAHQISKSIPKGSNIFIGNSLIIRAFNAFSRKKFNKVQFFSNRGASGIDGNLSTALGIASKSDKNNYLIIGDQSFMHDIGSLQILTNNQPNLTIFIINNYGGAIFDHLPTLNQIDSNIFKKYIRNEHSTNFKSIVESYQLKYERIKSIKDLKNINIKKRRVYEVMINNKKSLEFIRQFSTSLYQ
tara:strand:- start:2267 stop:3892 length:1626 start_codon:yes stop_codon:yes gene_type:complete